jgi:hypothetical protein
MTITVSACQRVDKISYLSQPISRIRLLYDQPILKNHQRLLCADRRFSSEQKEKSRFYQCDKLPEFRNIMLGRESASISQDFIE